MTWPNDVADLEMPTRAVPPWRASDVCATLGIWIAAQVAGALLSLAVPDLDPGLLTILALALTSCGAVGGVALVGALRGIDWQRMGLLPVTREWVWHCCLLGLGLFVLRVILMYGLVSVAPVLESGADLLSEALVPEGTLARLAVMLLGSLAAPLGEELLFRGVFYNALRRRWSFWPAALVSSLVFGGFHLIPMQVIAAAVLGVALCWTYERSHSLWAPVVVHAVNNLIGFILTFAGLAILD